jgi:RimJ/RimL family protein N-acetyltransferase
MKIDNSLELRPLNSVDIDLVYELYNCPEVYEQGILGYTFPQNDLVIKRKVESWLQAKDQKHYTINLDNITVGIAQIYNISSINKKCSIGIILKPEIMEQGIGKKIFGALVNICFKNLNIHKIEINIEEKNTRSIKIVEASKFILEGTLKDSIFKNGEYKDVLLYGLINK